MLQCIHLFAGFRGQVHKYHFYTVSVTMQLSLWMQVQP